MKTEQHIVTDQGTRWDIFHNKVIVDIPLSYINQITRPYKYYRFIVCLKETEKIETCIKIPVGSKILRIFA